MEDGCVIENLRVCGTIETSAKFAAGLIAHQYGNVTIRNCRSSVTIESSFSSGNGDGTHGGFVADNHNAGDITFEGCLFDGKLLTTGSTTTTRCGGFVGWRSDNDGAVIKVKNSLYAPAALEVGETWVSSTESATFVRNGIASDITNCYYTEAFGTAQGKLRHSITAGEHVSVANAGTATNYSVSGITSYGTGIKYGDVLYAGSGDVVSLTLSNTTPEGYDFGGYTANAGTLSGSDNPYTLTMPDADVTIGASFVEWTYYTITDWDTFCDWMTNDYENYKDKHYKLGNDVSATKMVGTLDYPFCGTFDGQGHTLNVKYSATSSLCSPFSSVSGTSSAPVVIKNLHVAGTIISTSNNATGFVGIVIENGNLTIENCRSSVDIESTYEGNGRHSGFVSRGDADATISIKDCVFDGSIDAPNSGQCAGFLATKQNRYVEVTIENCLFAPSTINVKNDANKTFARGNDNTITNCYYTQALGTAQGEEGILLYDGGVPATANAGVISRFDGEEYDVQLQGRSLYKDGAWNTLCLPFGINDFSGTPLEGATVMELDTEGTYEGKHTGLDGTTLYLYFKNATSIEAGKPYIVRWGTPESNPGGVIENPAFNGVTVSDANNDTAFTGGSFKGIYNPMSWDAEDRSVLFVGADNNLHWPLSGASLGACRAYFQLNGGVGASEFVLNFGEENTSISPAEIKEIRESAGAWYTINGVRLSSKPTKKGLYIHNGRKVVIP